jgi:N-acyl-phosphatidylethanolamine-hydrolysing phospholipase D
MSTWIWLAAGLLVFPLGASSSANGNEMDLEALSRQKAHHQKRGYTNPWLNENQPGGFFRFLKWKFASNPFKSEKKSPPRIPQVQSRIEKILNQGDSVTYLGHATFWIRLGNHNILTDPVFYDIGFFINRQSSFPLPPKDLPIPDVVLISHSHYDHLNVESLQLLGSLPLYLTPLGYKDWFKDLIPEARVVELDWFESFTYQETTYRLLPSQHWTKRTLGDTNRRLWGSWLIEGGGKKVFFTGDTGYFLGFKEFGEKFGPMDAALLPIGGYEPRWFMKPYHMNPQEAVQAFLDLKAKVLIPAHWGVFDLTDEPLDLPMRILIKTVKDLKVPGDEIRILPVGGTWYLPSARPSRGSVSQSN